MNTIPLIFQDSSYYDLLDPTELQIENIANSLSKLCRFNGHCKEFYSVAEHSIFCSHLAPDELQFAALLHDAHEALTGDITRPLKMYLEKIKPLEVVLQNYIEKQFNIVLSLEERQILKQIDNAALRFEAEYLFHNPFSDKRFIWPDPEDCYPISEDIKLSGLMCYYHKTAKQLFLKRFNYLK